VGGQRHAPAALPPGKTRYPLYRGLGGPQGRSGRVRKISPPTGIRSPDRPARSESLYRLSCPGPNVAPCRLVNSEPTFRKNMFPLSCAGSWRWRQLAFSVPVCLQSVQRLQPSLSVPVCLQSVQRLQPSLSVPAGCSETASRVKIMPVRSHTCQSGRSPLLLIFILAELTVQRNVDPTRGVIIVPPRPNEGSFLPTFTLALCGQHFARRSLCHPLTNGHTAVTVLRQKFALKLQTSCL
jgi:hypothetical protein